MQNGSEKIQVVIGPRQVGKSTAIQQALEGRGVYETADAPFPLEAIEINLWWDRALESGDKILAIDEIQKIQGWSEVIKKRWDEAKSGKTPRLKVILSGSAALAIEKNLRESLAGRYELIRADHWNFSEAATLFHFDLRRFIEFGCYPGSMDLLQDPTRWGAYIRDSIIEPVLGRDILQLHPVQQPALLRQLFSVAAANPAQVVSLHKLQGQLQDRGAIATLQHYLHLLSQGFLVSGIQKFSPAAIRTRKSSPKLVIHDNGLLRALERPVGAPLGAERFGRYFKNAVAARLLEAGWETYYWNDRQLEVDLVVLGPSGEKLAIEVKSGETSPAELRGLREFHKRFTEFEPCLISLIDQKIEGIRSWSAAEVLSLSSI